MCTGKVVVILRICLRPTADTNIAPSRERHGHHFRRSQAATVTTYLQIRGPSTAYNMQPCVLNIRSFRLRKAFAGIRCSSHQLLVQTGRHHVPQLQRKDRTIRICESISVVGNEHHILLHCPGCSSPI